MIEPDEHKGKPDELREWAFGTEGGLKEAENGVMEAQRRLGMMYYSGSGGEKNLDEAEKWLTKAVEQGVTPLDDNSQKAPVAEDADANDKPAASTSEDAATSAPAKTSALQKSLPKGAKVEKLARNDLLGHQISDPVMRKKIQDLYKRQDVVVQQYILPTN